MNTENTNQGAQETVISDYYTGYQELNLQSAETMIRKSRNTIFVVAALVVVGNLILMAATDSFNAYSLAITIVIAGIFIGLGLYTKKQPFTAIMIALVLYLLLWASDVVVGGVQYLYKGILVKGIILYFLIKGLQHAREAERIRRELGSQER
jgi:hypothetical protein